jgi:ADP-L-glycero-D-manno-heptose 6-epimerase
MIVITGAAGFIASNLVQKLNQERFTDLVLVDDFTRKDKEINWKSLQFSQKIHRNDFFTWLDQNHSLVQFIFHLGARTDTTEMNKAIFEELNLNYSKKVWNACVQFALPMVYASSAATYGDGEMGYEDDINKIALLKPLNPYGESKNTFDLWALQQEKKPFFWVGLKFFNVYGPGESHKGRMASVVFHAFHQIQKEGKMRLFRSHKPEYKDGEQLRDFIYVQDVVKVCVFLMKTRKHSGIYNLGTGKARSFNDLAHAVFKAIEKQEKIEYIDIPEDIRDKYQYFTQANMRKLQSIGYTKAFYTLEEGVHEYIKTLVTT